jgi:hypothetical protein
VVPFIRYSRDKRGYESTFVMHAYRPGQGPQRARVLYLFRTPAHVKIGRQALEPEVMEALEHTHPDLSFDWTNLSTERPAETFDARDSRDSRDGRDRRDRGHGRSQQRPAPRPSAPPPPAPVIEDDSPLGRIVGGERAARLRARYSELSQRIARRARTPEERDRLTERMQRLNPDEWGDEGAIRAALQTVDAEFDALAGELPSRRRGRRGGRHRHEVTHAPGAPVGPGPESEASEDQAEGPSGIIESASLNDSDGSQDDARDDSGVQEDDESDEDADDASGARELLARSGDDGRLGADPDDAADSAGADETGEPAAKQGPGGLPGDR